MDQPRIDVLAGAALPGQQNGYIRLRNLSDHQIDGLNRIGFAIHESLFTHHRECTMNACSHSVCTRTCKFLAKPGLLAAAESAANRLIYLRLFCRVKVCPTRSGGRASTER